MAGLNVDDILKRLGRQKTAEEQLAEGLSEKPAEVKTDAPVEEKKAEESTNRSSSSRSSSSRSSSSRSSSSRSSSSGRNSSRSSYN